MMEYEEFVSKIPEDTLEMLYELGEELDIDPLSSSESENYFMDYFQIIKEKKKNSGLI